MAVAIVDSQVAGGALPAAAVPYATRASELALVTRCSVPRCRTCARLYDTSSSASARVSARLAGAGGRAPCRVCTFNTDTPESRRAPAAGCRLPAVQRHPAGELTALGFIKCECLSTAEDEPARESVRSTARVRTRHFRSQ